MPETHGKQLVTHLKLVENNFTTTMQIKKHNLITNEPAPIGSDDFVPLPYDYLNASLYLTEQ